MNDPPPSTTFVVQNCLNRLKAGDAAARDELIAVAAERLRRLTRKMVGNDDRLRRWEDADDVFQNATLRLYQAIRDTVPDSSIGFFRLAALQIRRELVDLARHYFGPQGSGAKHASGMQPAASASPAEPPQSTYDSVRLAEWTEFHDRVDQLPDDERSLIRRLLMPTSKASSIEI